MKKSINAYFDAWKNMAKFRHLIIFFYLINLISTLILASPFTIYFKGIMKDSDILDNYQGYDVAAFLEFLVNYGSGLKPMLPQASIFLFVFFVFGVFTNAAILYAVISKNRIINMRAFINGGYNYLWKVLRLSIYFILSIVVSALVIFWIIQMSGINIFELETDRELIRKVGTGLIVFSLLFTFFSMVKQYAKIFIAIHQRPAITVSILNAGSFVLKKIFQTFILFVVNLGVLVLIIYLYYLIKNTININSWIVIFILGQLLLVFKICARIVRMDSNYKLYEELI